MKKDRYPFQKNASIPEDDPYINNDLVTQSLNANNVSPVTAVLFKYMSKTRAREEELAAIIKSLVTYNNALEQNRKTLEKTCVKLRNQAIRDPLTGLFNRRYMEATLVREAHRILRHDSSMGIIMIDADHFKWVNDNCGHHVGDLVLRSMGAYFRSAIRLEDIACRYGGEEFVLILPDIGAKDLYRRAEEMRKEIPKKIRVRHQQSARPITVSMGISVFPDQGGDVKKVLKMADSALYTAKRNGRNQVVMASD